MPLGADRERQLEIYNRIVEEGPEAETIYCVVIKLCHSICSQNIPLILKTQYMSLYDSQRQLVSAYTQ